MKEIMRRQLEQHAIVFGSPMLAPAQRCVLSRLLLLQGLVFGDQEVLEKFAIASYWEDLSGGRLHVTGDLSQALSKVGGSCSRDTDQSGQRSSREREEKATLLAKQGFATFDTGFGPSDVSASGASPVHDLFLTLNLLRDAGWPAPFLLVYDEAWVLIDRIWDLFTNLLGAECRLESDINVWSLLTPEQANTAQHPVGLDGKAVYIGCNFPATHRDMPYTDAHDAAENPTAFNAWMPLNPGGATALNGCLRVVPIESDDHFFSPGHPLHMKTASWLAMAVEDAAASVTNREQHLGTRNPNDVDGVQEFFPCPEGYVCAFRPSLIHCGGPFIPGPFANIETAALADSQPCGTPSPPTVQPPNLPRASIACTFREAAASENSPIPAWSLGGDRGGRTAGIDSMRRAQLATLPLQSRLRYAAKAIVSYAHWYPGLSGISQLRLQSGAAKCALDSW